MLLLSAKFQDLLGDGKGPIIPFGAMVENHPPSPKARIQQFWHESVTRNLFLAVSLSRGEFGKEILIADLEDLEMIDAPDMYPRRINAKEVLIRQKR